MKLHPNLYIEGGPKETLTPPWLRHICRLLVLAGFQWLKFVNNQSWETRLNHRMGAFLLCHSAYTLVPNRQVSFFLASDAAGLCILISWSISSLDISSQSISSGSLLLFLEVPFEAETMLLMTCLKVPEGDSFEDVESFSSSSSKGIVHELTMEADLRLALLPPDDEDEEEEEAEETVDMVEIGDMVEVRPLRELNPLSLLLWLWWFPLLLLVELSLIQALEPLETPLLLLPPELLSALLELAVELFLGDLRESRLFFQAGPLASGGV